MFFSSTSFFMYTKHGWLSKSVFLFCCYNIFLTITFPFHANHCSCFTEHSAVISPSTFLPWALKFQNPYCSCYGQNNHRPACMSLLFSCTEMLEAAVCLIFIFFHFLKLGFLVTFLCILLFKCRWNTIAGGFFAWYTVHVLYVFVCIFSTYFLPFSALPQFSWPFGL